MSAEYQKCFQPDIEQGGSRNIMIAENPYITIAVDTLVKSGHLVGQGTLMDSDVIYALSPERAYKFDKPVQLDGTPLYLTPQERLARPTHEELRLKRGGRIV